MAAVFAHLTPGRRNRHGALLGGIRRLHRAGWLRYDEPKMTVRLGPRVASWGSLELSTLRELWRMIPTDDDETGVAGDDR